MDAEKINHGCFLVYTGYALPKFAQLSVTSYYAASSASHYGISQITRLIEDSRTGGQHGN